MKKNGIVSRIKPKIRNLSIYKVKDADYEAVCMNKNENPYDLPQDIKKEILNYALERSWSRYPPIAALELYENIAEYTGWTPNGVVAGNGSDEMIFSVLTSFLEPGMKLVVPTPSFPMYSYVASIVGADVIEIPLNSDYTFDCDSLEYAFLKKGDMLVICSPNNPTGTLFPLDRLKKILEKTDAPVIVDEAYFEFSRITARDFLKSHDNLIIFRTFSKAFSMAGLRVGYALMVPELANEIEKVKIPFNLNFFSIAAACKVLKSRQIIENVVDEIIKARDALYEVMKTIKDVTVYPSHANFILFRTPYDSNSVFEIILQDGVLVRNLSQNRLLANTLRVTVSTLSDNERFIHALKRAMRSGIPV